MGAGASKKANPGLAELVAAADTDKDGIISVEELDAMLQETGIDWPRKRKEKLLGALDEDGNGKVDLAKFVKGTEQLMAVLEKLHPIWAWCSSQPMRRSITNHASHVSSVCVMPDGLHVVTGSGDNTARVWLLADGSLMRTLEGHTWWVSSVCVTPDGLHVVTGSVDNTARVCLL